MKKLVLPLDEKTRLSLTAGETVSVSGVIYTARDAAHKRIVDALNKGEKPPVVLKDFTVYYCGPTPALEGEAIGSCGPTTSSRMDAYTPQLIANGSNVMIGKGKRSDEVIDAIKKFKAVYLVAVGGAAALMKSYVLKSECLAYPDLGCEAIYKLQVKDMELAVAIDAFGNSILK